MKLKRLLSGVTAAIMALSAAAIASFTSASAAGEYVKIFSGDAGGKTFAQGVVDEDMAGATQVVISANSGPTPQGFNQYCTLQIVGTIGGASVLSGDLAPANPGWPGPASTTYTWNLTKPLVAGDSYVLTGYTYSWESCTSEDNYVFGITKVEFLDADGKVVKTQTEVGAEPPSQAPPATEPTKPVDPSKGEYTAKMIMQDQGFAWYNWNDRGNDATINGSGTYTVGVDQKACDAGMEFNTPYGFRVLCVDMDGMAKDLGASTMGRDDINFSSMDSYIAARDLVKKAGVNITDVSLILDGEEVYKFEDSDVMFGDFEANGNLRIQLFNEYQTGFVPNEDFELICLSESSTYTESAEVKFTLTYNKPTVNPNTTASTKAPGKVTTTKTPGKTTRSAADVKKDKKAAQKIMKQAKITKLTAKSKAKKKITVTWNKVKKAKGYQVQVAAKKNFKKSVLKKFTSKNKITVKSSKIKSKKTYYVRARAYATYKDKNGKAQKVYSKWSKKVRKVKVK